LATSGNLNAHTMGLCHVMAWVNDLDWTDPESCLMVDSGVSHVESLVSFLTLCISAASTDFSIPKSIYS
jgi:hypothetical protein